eukprot:scaffold2134_cov384-Prasinococcus_capsulatus_cf.AAC.15
MKIDVVDTVHLLLSRFLREAVATGMMCCVMWCMVCDVVRDVCGHGLGLLRDKWLGIGFEFRLGQYFVL